MRQEGEGGRVQRGREGGRAGKQVERERQGGRERSLFPVHGDYDTGRQTGRVGVSWGRGERDRVRGRTRGGEGRRGEGRGERLH